MEHPKDCTTLRPPIDTTQPDPSVQFYKNFIAGGIAGAVSRTAVSPLERAKILFQVQNGTIASLSGGSHTTAFDTLGGTFKRIWQREGLMGLFKGNGTNIIRIVPYSSMQFASYELFLKMIAARKEAVQTWQRLTAGACAGIIAATFTYPLDLARTRLSLASESQQGVGAIRTLINVVRHEGGLPALYRGLSPTLMGIAPLVAINFAVYERLKQQARSFTGTADVPVCLRLICGGLAGGIAQTVTYPLDVLRRRLQSSGLLGFNYTGLGDALRRIYREEGWRSFYRGLLPNYLKMVPAISVSFVVYEWVQSMIQ